MADGDTAHLLGNQVIGEDEPRGIQEQKQSTEADNGIRPEVVLPPCPDGSCVQSTGHSQDDEEQKAKKSMTLTQKLTFVGIAIAHMSVFTSFSVLAPFFPNEAKKIGVSSTETGLVFSVFSLVSFISCPICGKYLPCIGGKFMFLSGSFVAAGCNILFGFLDKIDDQTTFLIYCYVIRCVEAVGSAATLTAGMAIIANVFPQNVGQMSGILEMFIGLGFAIGPPMGSLFYGIGGYELPFIVLGCTSIVLTILNIFIIPSLTSSEEEDRRAGSVLEMLKIPAIWMVILVTIWSSAGFAFFDPTLALHLSSLPLSVNPAMLGVVFLLIGGMYGFTSPLWGYVADKTKNTRLMMILGTFFCGIAYLLVGPSPLLKVPSELWIIIISLALFGCGSGLAVMPTFVDMLISAEWYGNPDDLTTHSIVSGLYNAAFSLGSCLGPLCGGALVDQIGFNWTSTYYAGGCFVFVIIIGLFGVWEYQCGKGRRKPRCVKIVSSPGIQDESQHVADI